MKVLEKEILERVKVGESKDGVSVLSYAEYVYEKEICEKTRDGEITKTVKVWSDAINKALLENKHVYIPDMGEDIYLEDAIMMRSGYSLKVAENQLLVKCPNTPVTLIRNENLISGVEKKIGLSNPDSDITVEGGIWSANEPENGFDNGNIRLRVDREHSIEGVFAVMVFSNVVDITIKNLKFRDSKSYAVQISNCEGAFISDIEFLNFHKDGIHMNGSIKYAIVRNLSGVGMGDDMVAMNAWDWKTSAMSFGTLEKIIVENITSSHNEIRLLPGRKTYISGEKNDCKIKDTIMRNIKGVYTFKLYSQPNIHDTKDRSEIPGNIENVYFENIDFPEVSASGFGGLPVEGLFDVCVDTKDVYFNNIRIKNTISEFEKMGVKLIKVGPLSATWKGGKENPEEWTEVFAPDDICTAENLHIGKISFSDRDVVPTDEKVIVCEKKQTLNPDYPNTLPKGGTGYGIVKNVIF